MMRGGKHGEQRTQAHASVIAGWAGWLLQRIGRQGKPEVRLRLVQRIAIAPRQSLSLVEVEGRRILLATGADGAPAFYPLDDLAEGGGSRDRSKPGRRSRRIAW